MMLDDMGQTKQIFYETFTRTVLRERSIPFIIKSSLPNSKINNKKIEAFEELEAFRKNIKENIDINNEREEAIDEKYGYIG